MVGSCECLTVIASANELSRKLGGSCGSEARTWFPFEDAIVLREKFRQ